MTKPAIFMIKLEGQYCGPEQKTEQKVENPGG